MTSMRRPAAGASGGYWRAAVRPCVPCLALLVAVTACERAPVEPEGQPTAPGGMGESAALRAGGSGEGVPAALVSPEAAKRAGEILSATGVRGGLVVHVGSGDGTLTAALALAGGGTRGAYLVHGLDTDEASVNKAREQVRALGVYGKVSVERWAGKRLPYVDNLVNLVVCGDADLASTEELLRVLAPGGVAYVSHDGAWTKTVKPRPREIDEWTHYLHDATGNAVSRDTVVGPPRRLRWVGSPRWARHHDHMASMSALVAAGGRLFYIMDEGPTASIQLPPEWRLVARDAFSGVVLWKRVIPKWNTHRWPLKSGPAQLPRRMVAEGETLYVTLELDAPLSAVDAATGETVRTYDGTANTEEVILSDGVLFVLVSDAPSRWPEFRQRDAYVWANTRRANSEWAWDEKARRVMAVEAGTGKTLWTKDGPVAPLTLAADGGRVCFHDGEKVICLDRKTGGEVWRSEAVARRKPSPVCFGPTLVMYEDVVLFAGGTRSMSALDLGTGRTLWTEKHLRGGHQSPEDLLVAGGLAWSGAIATGKDSGLFVGRDLRTGEAKVEFKPDVKIFWFHHRCHRAKATERFLLTSRTGIEFIDFRKKHWETQHWVRGGCIYGIMPAYGMVYAPPHSCGCYLEGKLNGLNALAPAVAGGRLPEVIPAEDRLERGPAYGKVAAGDATPAAPGEWPTYRHDPARSGRTKAVVPTELGRVWRTEIESGGPGAGGRTRVSSVVVAGGKVFVASVDTHTVHALDAATGEPVWSFTSGGRVDSPPTVHRGRVIFGSADGRVYCLRASDGEMVWRFRAAPVDERVTAFEQVESVWPVHGSVLVVSGGKGGGEDGSDVVYCAAGRSMFLDGGIRLVRLDAETGRMLSETVLDERDPETGENLQVHVKGLNMPMSLPDVLSSDGRSVYMRSQRFDMEGKRPYVAQIDVKAQEGEGAHLFCQIGFLDDSWFHRGYWLYGRAVAGGYGGWFQAARNVPSGRILVFDDATVYGYGRRPEYVCNASVLEYSLFAANKQADDEAIQRVRRAQGRINVRSTRKNANSSDWKLRRAFPASDLTAVKFKWTTDHPSVQARAMVLAGGTLFVAGPPDVVDERRSFRLPDDEETVSRLAEQRDALYGRKGGRKGGRLWAVSASDGKVMARYRLDSVPVFDGMAAAGGKLFLATMDGKVVCLGGGEAGKALPRADDEPEKVISDEPDDADYLAPPEVMKDGDFDRVQACAVLASKLGYRLRQEDKKRFGFAVRELGTPLRKRAVIRAKLRPAPPTGTGTYFTNGFIAFGDGTMDGRLVKCGARIFAQKAQIIQGRLEGGKTASRDIEVESSGPIDVTVTVDLEGAKVTMTLAQRGESVTVEAPLALRMKAVTHVGYCVAGACTDFGPIKTTGE